LDSPSIRSAALKMRARHYELDPWEDGFEI
jgi:hypothetical protein